MPQEVICPKCGSPEVTEKTLLIYRRSGKRVWGKRPFLLVLASVSLLLLILTSVAGLINSLDQWYDICRLRILWDVSNIHAG